MLLEALMIFVQLHITDGDPFIYAGRKPYCIASSDCLSEPYQSHRYGTPPSQEEKENFRGRRLHTGRLGVVPEETVYRPAAIPT